MKTTPYRFLIATLVAMLAASQVWGAARAVSDSPAQIAEYIRSSLVEAQLSLTTDAEAAALFVKDAETAYQAGLSNSIAASDPDAHERVLSAFEDLTSS